MANVVIPSSIVTPFAKTTGNYTAVYSKPAGSTSATVFVADAHHAAALTPISKNVASAAFTNGVLHVNLGAAAAGRSSAGIAAEGATHSAAVLTRG